MYKIDRKLLKLPTFLLFKELHEKILITNNPSLVTVTSNTNSKCISISKSNCTRIAYCVKSAKMIWINAKTLLIKDRASENLRKFDAFSGVVKDRNTCRLQEILYIFTKLTFHNVVFCNCKEWNSYLKTKQGRQWT